MSTGRSKQGWGLLWRSKNKLDGESRYLMWDKGMPLFFNTRWRARYHRDMVYGYIRERPDLQREPHGWQLPAVVKVTMSLYETETKND